jgi:hypothetical protein
MQDARLDDGQAPAALLLLLLHLRPLSASCAVEHKSHSSGCKAPDAAAAPAAVAAALLMTAVPATALLVLCYC